MNDKIKVLFLSANPTDDSIRPEVSIREIEEGIKRGKIREKFDFVSKMAVTTRDISRAILDEKPDIVHFSAKGENLDSLIVAAADGSGPKAVTANALADLFEVINERHPVQCVVVAAAVSKEALTAISKHVPFVIGMSQELKHDGVRSFEVGFYDGLVVGDPIPFSFDYACSAMGMDGFDRKIPVILKREEHAPGLFREHKPPTPQAKISHLEAEGLKNQLEIYQQKLNFFRIERATTADAETKFALDQKITEIEKSIAAIRQKLGE
ncbi:MAG: hypothetical protein SF052_13215 [Bacteroidia bacterium]|nr:hypothetical protein [Bacteroidia bacterium]